MKKDFDHATLLYHILPAVYRERDRSGDLRRYLKGCGRLLDQLHHTLQQRYADIFPLADKTYDLDSQPWVLPYIAALLDVRLVSPLDSGRREEIARAITWRKAKGTLRVVEEVAEAVGGLEVVLREGWTRVATTPRPGLPLVEPALYGYPGEAPNPAQAPMAARHPALPAGTVDLRCPGGAVAAPAKDMAAQISHIGGRTFRWRQSSLHGAPSCRQGASRLPMPERAASWMDDSFDDPSVRTVDLRVPNWRYGHAHPRRVVLFTPTPPGFFPEIAHRFSWSEGLLEDPNFLEHVLVAQEGETTVVRNRSLDQPSFEPVQLRNRVRLRQTPETRKWRFEGLVFRHTIEVESGALELRRCAVLAVEVDAGDGTEEEPVLAARDCLFKRIQAEGGTIHLAYCTVLGTTVTERLFASDSLFDGKIQRLSTASLPGAGCVRYSAVPPDLPAGDLQLAHHQLRRAVFLSREFGDAGCGVLHPATPATIATGAEDGGEMGAYHHAHLVAARRAVIEKLHDFLPAGMQAVIALDPGLNQLPGEIVAEERP